MPCNCKQGETLGGGFIQTEWYCSPKAAALAAKRHVERVREGDWPYWCVHYGTPDSAENTHVVSVVIDGLRYGPSKVEPA